MIRSSKRRYCAHCKQNLTVPVFKRHKASFYDEIKKEWRTDHEVPKYDDVRDAQDDSIIMINSGKLASTIGVL